MEGISKALTKLFGSTVDLSNPYQQLVLGMTLFFSLFKLFSAFRFWIRAVLLFFCYVVTSTLGVSYSIIFKIVGRPDLTHYCTARTHAFICSIFLNQRYIILDDSVIKQLNGKPAIYIGNHQSTLDVNYLGIMFPTNTAMMVKKSLMYVPFLGIYIAFSNTLKIDRKNRKKAIEASNELGKEMIEKNMGVFIYAEGTRSGFETPELLPFKKGAFHLALQTGFPIVPVVFSNTSHLFNAKRWIFESGSMGIKVLPPINVKGKSKEQLDEIIDEAHKAMKDCLVEISSLDYSKI